MTSAGAARFKGALEGMRGGLLYGWCVDTVDANARVVLEVRLNGQATGCVIADVARTDLAAQMAPGDCCHGFVAEAGWHERDLEGTLTVCVANTGVQLAGSVTRESAPAPASAASMVFGDGGLKLHGWTAAQSGSAGGAVVRAYIGERELASTTAGLAHHPALRHHGITQDGFVLDLPPSLADGRLHSVRVTDAAGAPLNGSPVTVCCYLDGAAALLSGEDGAALASVLRDHERYLPRSLGMGFYPDWAARFDAPGKKPRSRLRVTLIVSGGTPAQIQATQDSLDMQKGIDLTVIAGGPRTRAFGVLARQALAAGGDVAGCVRAGDTLAPGALAHALQGFQAAATQIVYTDSQHDHAPWFKPAWNLDYALCSDYPLELMLARTSLLRDYLQEHPAPRDAASLAWGLLAAACKQGESAIVHVPRVLYIHASAPDAAEKQARMEAAQAALQALDPASCLETIAAPVQEMLFQPRRLRRPLSRRERDTAVTLIVPTRDRVELLERCITSLRRHTQWPRLEIMVIDNDSAQDKTRRYLRALAKDGVTVLPCPGPFNFAEMNNRAVAAATGTVVGLINNDIEALHAGWLDEMVGQLLRPGVGAVGAKLLWPNGMVQHGGILLGLGHAAGHFGNRLADGDWGDHGRNQLPQQVSGVTAACMLLRKSDYQAVGGMDAAAFPVTFNDVDLCLKLRQAGKSIVWTPHARLLHAESASRGKEESPQQRARAQRELGQLRRRWGEVLLRDPAYHPSLNLDAHGHAFGGLAMPPRDRSPRTSSVTPC